MVDIQREAARSALMLRRSLSTPRDEPVNIYDVSQSIGVAVFFQDLPSLEGMFYRGPDPVVILPSLKHRPRGRVSYTCAHEIGHFQLGHGTQVDEYVDQPKHGRTPEEVAADTFAATLLMPRPAVLKRFRSRDWSIESASPVQLYRVAVELDVGYMTLLKHLRFGLDLVTESWLSNRERAAPKAIRHELLPNSNAKRIVVVDSKWPDVPIDLEVGDRILLIEGSASHLPDCMDVDDHSTNGQVLKAVRQGQGLAELVGIRRTIRVARTGYCGALKYRYFADPEDE